MFDLAAPFLSMQSKIEPISFYHTPSKYDQDYRPITQDHRVCRCADSGVTALIYDLGQLGKDEIERISAYLKTNSSKTSGIRLKLKTLEQTLRGEVTE